MTTTHPTARLCARSMARLVACMVALAGSTSLALTQPEQPTQSEPPAERRPAREGRPGQPDAAALRERLQSRLDELQEQRRQLRAALERLEQGASPGEVLRDLGPFIRGQGRGEGVGRGEALDRPPPPDGMREEGRPGPGMRGEGRGEGRGLRGPQRPPLLSAEERERLMTQVREHAPDLAARVEAIEARDPETARRLGARMLPRLHEAMRLREGDPEAFRLKIRELTNSAVVFEAMRAFRDASEADPAVRTEREQALRAALADQFAIRRETLARDIDSLSKRLDRMRSDLEQGEAEQQATIDRVIQSVKEFHDEFAPQPPEPR